MFAEELGGSGVNDANIEFGLERHTEITGGIMV
jgi:hypothetical protein